MGLPPAAQPDDLGRPQRIRQPGQEPTLRREPRLARRRRDRQGWAEERGVALKLEGTANVTGDRLLLQRALGNLLSNAIRHTPAGGTVRVKLMRSSEGNVGITVENPGPEIPSEHLPRLFDRFYRVDPSRQRRGEGAGLGLAIVKSVVDAHGGRVDVTSAAGVTAFQIILPQAADAAA